ENATSPANSVSMIATSGGFCKNPLPESCKIPRAGAYQSMADLDSGFQTRPSLLARIKDARDDEAWTAFLDTYAPAVYRYCRRKGLQHPDAADVTQEVMAQVARSAGGFEYRPEQGRFRDWLGVVTHSKLANHLRAARRT